MHMSSEKTLKTFTQLVDPQVEPVVKYGFVKKFNQSGGESQRFFVATHSAMYLCRHPAFIRLLKINHVYAWVDLLSFNMTSPNVFSFTFRSTKVTLSIPNAQSFLAPVLSSLRALLPTANANCIIHAPAGMQIQSATQQPTQFVDIFLSFCHSMSIVPNENLITNLRRTLIKKQPLEILQVSFEQQILQAICSSLTLVRTVRDLTIGGFTFPDLFTDLTRILVSNNTIESLRIVNYSKHSNFSDFILSVSRSGLKSLTFVSISFQRAMIQTLVDAICLAPMLKHLGFVNCNFDSFIFGSIFDSPDSFKNLESFEIGKDENEISLSFIPNMISFLTVSGICNLSLTEMSTDIALIFSSIENTPNLELKSINLSGNYCSKSYKRSAVLPYTLETLKLSDVRWDGTTLCHFLKYQQYKTEISLDLSNASFTGSNEIEPFENLENSSFPTMVVQLIWDNNILTHKLLAFLSKSASLRLVSLEMCVVPEYAKEDFVECLKNYISETCTVNLSLRGSLRPFKSDVIIALKDILIDHRTIEEINVSDNGFGDKGIETLGEIICNTKNIILIKCDGENPKQTDLYINFLNKIAESENAVRVSKPRNDIALLISKSKNFEQALRIAWRRCVESMNEIPSKMKSRSFLTAQTEEINDSQPLFEIWPATMIDASWEITIELGYNGSREEWDKIGDEFTIENIIGINGLEDSDQSDLIDFS